MRPKLPAALVPPHLGAKDRASRLALWLEALGDVFAERGSLAPAARFALRSLVHPRPTLRLLRHFDRTPRGLLPRLVRVDCMLKLGREHVRRGLGAAARADMLIAHHAALRQVMGDAALSRFLAHEPLRLARLGGPEPLSAHEVWLYRAPFGYRREGEATLSIVAQATGARVTDLTFTIGHHTGGRLCLRIGGMQGPPPPNGKDAVKAATKALDGLRPKAVAIEAVYALGHLFGVEAVLATRLSHHVLLEKKGHRMNAAAYDGFWEEIGGVALPNGDFLLPPAPPHRAAADVPAKRRKGWERRQHHIATLTEAIAAAFAALRGRDAAPFAPMPLPAKPVAAMLQPVAD